MARPLRIEYAGALYRLMNRGNNRQAIVKDEVDQTKRLMWYRHAVNVYGWRVIEARIPCGKDHQ